MKFTNKECSEFQGVRLDKFLTANIKGGTRSQIQKLIKTGLVLVNNHRIKSSYTIQEKDEILVKELLSKDKKLEAENLNVPIIFENQDYLVIDKPSQMVTHPGDDGLYFSGTVVNAVLDKVKVDDFEDILRPGIVHRLDKETSGLLIIARNKKAYEYFVSQFKERKIRKFYKALVVGEMEHPQGIIDSPIGRDLKNRKKMSLKTASGKAAVTKYKLEQVYNFEGETVSLVDIELMTGRTHQIRVHFTALRNPVVGDYVYGSRKINTLLKPLLGRQFLHAYKLEFNDLNGEKVSFESKVPKDLNKVLANLIKV